MYAGEIVEQGAVDTLFHDPRHPYTRLLFAATPDLHDASARRRLHPGGAAAARPAPRRLPVPPRAATAPSAAAPTSARCSQRYQGGHEAACHLNDVPAEVAGLSSNGSEPLVDGREPRRPLSDRARARRHGGPPRAPDGACRRRRFLLVAGRRDRSRSSASPAAARRRRRRRCCGSSSRRPGLFAFDGRDITGLGARALRPLRRRMQLIYQDPYESLDPRFRVRQAVEEPLADPRRRRARRQTAGSGCARRSSASELTPPDLFLDRYPHELSGGQRQRVAIAASLVLEPRLLVADEPVSMLDVSVRAGILGLLDGLRSGGLGILMITHDLSTAARFADRIAVMYLGRIVEEGPARQVVEQPMHPYTRALLSVVPDHDPRRRRKPQILRGEPPDAVRVPPGCRFRPRCPIAVDDCKTIDPPLEPKAPGQRAACIRT